MVNSTQLDQSKKKRTQFTLSALHKKALTAILPLA